MSHFTTDLKEIENHTGIYLIYLNY